MTENRNATSSIFLESWVRDSGLKDEFDYLCGLSRKTVIDASWFRRLERAPTMMRICITYSGIPTRVAEDISKLMDIPIRRLASDLGIHREFNRSEDILLSANETEKFLRLCCLIGRAGVIVEESGLSADFDPAAWLSGWLYSPLPTMAGELPVKLVGSSEGVACLRQQVDAMQSAAYL